MKHVTPKVEVPKETPLLKSFNDMFGKYLEPSSRTYHTSSEDLMFTMGLLSDLTHAKTLYPSLTKELNHLISLLEEEL